MLGSSSRKPPNHLKNRANPWLKTAMAASQGMQDQISNAMSTIEDVLGNLRWGGHFLHPQKKFAHCLGGAVFFRWGGGGVGGEITGVFQPANLPMVLTYRYCQLGVSPHPPVEKPTRVNSTPTPRVSGVCRSRNARAGRWTWKIRTTLRKSAKAFFSVGKKTTSTKTLFRWKIGPHATNDFGKAFVFGGSFVFFPKMRNKGKTL